MIHDTRTHTQQQRGELCKERGEKKGHPKFFGLFYTYNTLERRRSNIKQSQY